MSYAGKVQTSSGSHLVGSTLYGICNNSETVVNKTVSISDFDQLLTGVTIHVKFTNTNNADNPTLNVENTGAYPIYRHGTQNSGGAPGKTEATSWKANSVLSLTFDGTAWRINDVGAEEAILNQVTSAISTETTNRQAAVSAALQKLAVPYSTSIAYALGDLVVYNDGLYVCTTATTAGAWTAANWTAVTVDGQFTRRLQFANVTVDDDDFVADETYTDYGFRAEITLAGVTSSMVADVIFGTADAASGVFAPVADTDDGAVYIYAESKPSNDIVIPTIIVWR